MRCFKPGCPQLAKYAVAIRCWADEQHKADHRAAPMLLATSADVCEFHRGLITLMDVLSDDEWTATCNMIAASGKRRPMRSIAELYYPSLDDPLVRAWRGGLRTERG